MLQEVICGKMLKKDYEAARLAAEEREQKAKEEEKRRKEEARLERQRRQEEEKKNKGKKKPGQKKDGEADQEQVNKDDSREGIRAYARGRAYIPDRFGGVLPYKDPNELAEAERFENFKKSQKNKKGRADSEQAVPEDESDLSQQTPALQSPAEESVPAQAAPEAEIPQDSVEGTVTEVETAGDGAEKEN